MNVSNKRNLYHRKQHRPSHAAMLRALRLILICLTLAGLSTLFVGGYHVVLSSPLLRVTSIQVSGCRHLDPETVIAHSGISSGVNILSLDLKAVSRRVTAHPWVKTAVIIREIPDRIRIEIEERQPIALVRGQHFQLMDLEGHCFVEASPADYPGLPIISGLKPENLGPDRLVPPAALDLISALYSECQTQLPWRLISEINWDESSGLRIFTVRGGVSIRLGRTGYGLKMARLEKVLHYLADTGTSSQLLGIDLDYRDRLFVRGRFPTIHQDRIKQRGV